MDIADTLLAIAAVAVFIWAAVTGAAFGMLIAALVLAGVVVRRVRGRRSTSPQP